MVGLSDGFRDFEHRLEQQALQVNVFEELGLTFQDFRFLRQEIKGLFAASPPRAISLLRQRGRYSTVAFLTLVGAYKYAQGDSSAAYWPHVANALEVNTVPQGDWGKLVEDLVLLNGLVAFPRAEGGRRFVDLILLHSGIPNGCLANYFDRVLRHSHPTSTGQDIISIALHPSQERYLLRPVARYLRLGGDVAADFVERTIDLASHGQRLHETEDSPVEVLRTVASAVGLPVRFVKEFRDWLSVAPSQRSGSPATGRYWKSPTLRFDPFQLALVFDLPAQELNQPADNSCWMLSSDTERITLDVPAWRRANTWRTDAHVHAVTFPQLHYDVHWWSSEGERRWSLPGMSLRWPILAFHGRDGHRIYVDEGLPRDVLWILHPEDHSFKCEEAVLVEKPLSLSGPWSGYVAEHWDLRPCATGTVPRIGEVELWLRPDGDVRPRFTEQSVTGVTSDGTPVFSSWPTLIVPRARVGEQIERWSLQWSTLGDKGEVPLHELARDSGSGWEINLGLAGLPSYASLLLRVRGLLGRSARFSLSVWEGLHVEGTRRLLFPSTSAQDSVELTIELPNGLELSSAEGCHYESSQELIRIAVSSSVDFVRLRVGDGGFVYPLELAVPRLRSQLFDAAITGASTALATGDQLSIQGDWLDQAALPRVAFDTRPSENLVEFVEVDFGDGDTVTCPRVAGWANMFDLSELAQAAAARRCARARLWARVGRDRALVGDWRARLGLEGLNAVVTEDVDGCTVRANWEAGRFVDGVQARLWSIWSPWDDHYQSEAKPEGPSACMARFDSISPGDYLYELVVADPWTVAPVQRPAADAPEVTQVEIGSERDRRERLGSGTGVHAAITRYLAASGNSATRMIAWRAACDSAKPSDIPLLLSVAGIEAGEELWERLARAQHDRLFDFLERAVDNDRSAVVTELATEDSPTLAAYAVVLGFLDTPPEDWGGQWEPLAVCGAGEDVVGDSHRLIQMAERLGLQLVPDDSDLLDDVEPSDAVMLAGVVASRQPFGDMPNDAFTAMRRRQIQDIQKKLGLVPGGPLSPDAQAFGYAEWLVSRMGNHIPSDLLVQHVADLKTDLRNLQSLDVDYFGTIVQVAFAREHALASGREAPQWLNVPFAVGAVTVLLRAQALSSEARRLLEGHRNWIRSVALHALQAAPTLFAHDLCWVHLELIDT